MPNIINIWHQKHEDNQIKTPKKTQLMRKKRATATHVRTPGENKI